MEYIGGWFICQTCDKINQGMKRSTYIALFGLLGVIVQFLAHAGLEIFYIGLLLNNFEKYSLGYGWDFWVLAHNVGAVSLFLAGLIFGIWQGKYWWKRIYEK